MRASAAALLVSGLGLTGCSHGIATAPPTARDAVRARASVSPPVCHLPDGEEPNCSCDAGGCSARIGVLYADVGRDGEAKRLFEHACARGSALGCNNLGTFLLAGRAGPRDERAAAQLFERACRHKDPSACYNFGVLYEDGTAVERDELIGAELLQQSCSLGMAHACLSLGLLYARGLDGRVDVERAHALFVRACAAGESPACERIR